MRLEELTAADIRDIASISRTRDAIERPEEYTLGDVDSPEWDEWRSATANLVSRIEALSQLARAELTALAWLGRGDSGNNFGDLVAHATRSSDSGDSRYLASKAPLHSYLQDGARKLGVAI